MLDATFIDGGGPGGGMVDRLRQLQHSVFDVQFGSKADHSHIGQDGAIVYANVRLRARGDVCARTIPLSLEALSAFGGGPEDFKTTTGRYPTTSLPIDVKF